ncbi:MAG: SH3 domain-containing protein [Brotaphodocola sp.]
MATTSGNNSWDKIQLGVKDTERKIGQREYNSAMITARQTLEFMVKLLAERACIVDGGELKDMIDTLYQNQWISKTTCEHYHKIRILGDKASKEGDSNAYNANQAYHMLSQEVYTFANDYSNAKKGTRVKSVSRASSPTGKSSGSVAKTSVQSSRTYVSSASRSRKRTDSRRPAFTVYDIMKLLIPVLCIILLFCVVKLFKPGADEKETTAAPISTEAMQETPASAENNTPEVIYRAATNLNVRKSPSTDGEKLGQLAAGSAVEYVQAYDSEWAEILYQGETAYVASQYLTTE